MSEKKIVVPEGMLEAAVAADFWRDCQESAAGYPRSRPALAE